MTHTSDPGAIGPDDSIDVAAPSEDSSHEPEAAAAAAPPAPVRKRPKPGERRVQILQTLATMLEQPGAERITTAALAARLDVSEAALYRHFASKAQMFEGLIEFIEHSVFTLINQIHERETAAATQVSKMLGVLLQFGEKNPGMARVMVGDALVFENERLLARMNQFFERFESQLRQSLRGVAQAAGSVTPTVDASAQASVLTSFAIGRLQRYARSGFKRPRPNTSTPRCACSRLSGGGDKRDGPSAGPPHTGAWRVMPEPSLTVVTMVTLEVRGQTLLLLPEKAVFLPESDTLLVADAHIGSAQGLRRLGAPAPPGTTDETLSALTGLVRRLDVKRVVFLGEFLHSVRLPGSATLAALTRWRELHSAVELTLVRASHDDRTGDPPLALDIQAFTEPLMHRGLALCHHPRPIDGAFVLGGHLHPCVSIGGRAHDWQRLPCFWFSERVGVLPAFGAFTGMQAIRVRRGERAFAAAADRVFELLPKPRRR